MAVDVERIIEQVREATESAETLASLIPLPPHANEPRDVLYVHCVWTETQLSLHGLVSAQRVIEFCRTSVARAIEELTELITCEDVCGAVVNLYMRPTGNPELLYRTALRSEDIVSMDGDVTYDSLADKLEYETSHRDDVLAFLRDKD